MKIEVISVHNCPYEKDPPSSDPSSGPSSSPLTSPSLLSRSFFGSTHLCREKRPPHSLAILKIISLIDCKRYGINREEIESDLILLRGISHSVLLSSLGCYYLHEVREFYWILPFIEGISLKEIIWKLPQSFLSDQMKWFKEVMTGLDYLHQVIGISHGKLIPENIIITSSNHVKIVGIDAPCLRIPLNRQNPKDILNLSYVSYERYNGMEYDHRDDIWAIGLIFAELLLGLKREREISQRLNDLTPESDSLRRLLITDCLDVCPQMGSIIELSLQTLQKNRANSTILNSRMNRLSPNVIPLSSPLHPSRATGSGTISQVPKFAAGDVVLVENFLDKEDLIDLIENISDEITWFQLNPSSHSTSSQLNNFQAMIDEDGTMPIYRNPDPQPWDHQYTTSQFTPTIKKLKENVESLTGEVYNWCRILQCRNDDEDSGFHSDKYLDIKEGSYVASYSIGQPRDFVIKLKKGIKPSDKIKYNLIAHHQKITLSHNSLLLLGPLTSRCYLHSISKKNHHSFSESSTPRISIIFRNIATYYCPLYQGIDQNCFFGQGVTDIKSKSQLIHSHYLTKFKRHFQTFLKSSLFYMFSSSFWSLFNLSSPTLANLIGFTTLSAALLSRYSIISQVKASEKQKKWRQMVVFRLLKIFPIDPPEALRLLERASSVELESLVELEKIAKHPKDYLYSVAHPLIYSYHSSNSSSDGKIELTSVPLSTLLEQQHKILTSKPRNIPPNSIVSSSNQPDNYSPTNISKSSGIICIIVDILNDFVLTTGAYCQAFGIDDTHRIRLLHSTIIDIYHHCHQKNIQIVLVTSKYRPKQFKRVPGLCVTDYGQQICLPSGNNSSDIIHEKYSNSILDCEDTNRSQLIQLVQNKKVFVCGVTTVCCVRYAVNDLLEHCQVMCLAKDGVASRDSCYEQEQELFRKWDNSNSEDTNPSRGIITVTESWRDILN